jgi:hypothetical protein
VGGLIEFARKKLPIQLFLLWKKPNSVTSGLVSRNVDSQIQLKAIQLPTPFFLSLGFCSIP